jgi:hypothetical protein
VKDSVGGWDINNVLVSGHFSNEVARVQIVGDGHTEALRRGIREQLAELHPSVGVGKKHAGSNWRFW